jgi:hypothetical protein
LAAVLAGTLVLGGYKLVHLGTGALGEISLGLGLDVCVWSWLWLLCALLAGPHQGTRARVAWRAFQGVFGLLLLLSFSYTFFYDTAVERRVSLLDMKLGAATFFFRSVLPRDGWIALVSLAVCVVLSTSWFKPRLPRTIITLLVMASLTGVTAYAGARVEHIANPLADMAADLIELANTPHVQASRVLPAGLSPRMLDRREPGPLPGFATPFTKVLVFVLESVTAQDFAREQKALGADTFLRAATAHVHAYTRYFPGNQDSRTGMLGMLSARVNPYEAYSDEDVAHYRRLAQQVSLIGRMNALGYRTAFAVAQLETELVVRDLPFAERLHLSEEQRTQASQKFLCLNPYEFEHSCEDLALLPQVLDFIDSNERAFLYQEFVWGHSWAYNERLKQSNAQYYSRYIDAVLAHLKARGLAEKTLVVIVSDHGMREREKLEDPEQYHIPLWFHAQRFTAHDEQRLLSHLDFKDLLLSELSLGKQPPAPANPFVLIAGPTSSSLWAAVIDDGDFMLLKSRGDVHLLLKQQNFATGRASPARNLLKPEDMVLLRSLAQQPYEPPLPLP